MYNRLPTDLRTKCDFGNLRIKKQINVHAKHTQNSSSNIPRISRLLIATFLTCTIIM